MKRIGEPRTVTRVALRFVQDTSVYENEIARFTLFQNVFPFRTRLRRCDRLFDRRELLKTHTATRETYKTPRQGGRQVRPGEE